MLHSGSFYLVEAHTGRICEGWQWARKGLANICKVMGQCAKAKQKTGKLAQLLFLLAFCLAHVDRVKEQINIVPKSIIHVVLT